MTNPNRIVQAKTVSLWLAAVGSPIPADLADPAAPFFGVGLTNPESCRFRVSPQFERILAHQSNHPVKIVQTTDAAGMDVDLMEWSGDNFKAVYGGGAITEIVGPPVLYKFVPPSFGNRQELAAILDVIDGAKQYRFIAPRVFNESEVETLLNKSPEARLPLRLSILGGDATDAWYLVTNDAAFEVTP